MDPRGKIEEFMMKGREQVPDQVAEKISDGMDQIKSKLQAGLQSAFPVAEELAIEVKDETDVGTINTGFVLEHPREVCLNI